MGMRQTPNKYSSHVFLFNTQMEKESKKTPYAIATPLVQLVP